MQTKFGLLDSDLLVINSILIGQPKIESAIIFGSRAKGTSNAGSDVDIALKGNFLIPETVRKISFSLNEETSLPYYFDVIDYNAIDNQKLKEHINRVGVEFYKYE